MFLLLNATFTIYILLLHTPRNTEEHRHRPWGSHFGSWEHCRTSIAVTYLQGEQHTAKVWEQCRAVLKAAGSCLITKGTSITGRSSKRIIWNISYVSRSSENYISCIWPRELKIEAAASLAAESGLCRCSSARPVPPQSSPTCARPRIPSRRAAPGQKGSGKPRAATSDPNPAGDDTQRPAPRAAPQAPAGRHSSPARLAGARPVPLAGAVQTRWRRPSPLRPSGSSAAPQYGMLDGPEGGRAFPPSVAASRGCHGLGGEAGPWVQRVRADGAALPRPAYLCALLRRQGCRGPELVPGLRDGWGSGGRGGSPRNSGLLLSARAGAQRSAAAFIGLRQTERRRASFWGSRGGDSRWSWHGGWTSERVERGGLPSPAAVTSVVNPAAIAGRCDWEPPTRGM